jgi:hypothetical protein
LYIDLNVIISPLKTALAANIVIFSVTLNVVILFALILVQALVLLQQYYQRPLGLLVAHNTAHNKLEPTIQGTKTRIQTQLQKSPPYHPLKNHPQNAPQP